MNKLNIVMYFNVWEEREKNCLNIFCDYIFFYFLYLFFDNFCSCVDVFI